MNIVDYVLTYCEEGSNTPLVTVEEYYERFVKPLNPAFEKSSFKTSNTVICCFHDDINPSLGTIKHKHLKGVRIYHCFGCGAAGTVIRMHQRIEKEYHHRTISEEESALELCKLFGIDAEKYKNIDTTKKVANAYVDKMKRIAQAMGTYTIAEFKEDLLPARGSNVSVANKIAVLNSASVKMIATKKKLFD